ncbi:hypothetical protein [Vibrio phage VCPH]|nr:hypothetical protein [Vibrio phage VCPH]
MHQVELPVAMLEECLIALENFGIELADEPQVRLATVILSFENEDDCEALATVLDSWVD